MERFLVFMAGAGFGAIAGRWLNRDPRHSESIKRSRLSAQGEETALDVVHRTQFLLREIRALVVHAQVPDAVLEERIKAKVARMIHRPDAVQVSVRLGKVSLLGTARQEEIRRFTESVAALRGVKEVENRLEALTPPFTSWDDAEPGSRPPRRKPGSYPPLVSAIMASAGAALALAGLRMRGGPGAIAMAGGAVLMGAGAAGLLSPGAFSAGNVSHVSESSSWRPLKGTRSTASP